MRIEKIDIFNFKGIRVLELNLMGKSTIFFGVNGMGKSSILKAIDIVFHKQLQKAIGQQYKQYVSVDVSDIKIGNKVAQINALISDEQFEHFEIRASLNREKNKCKLTTSVSKYPHLFNEYYVQNENTNMPIYASYGVHRIVLDVPLRIKKNHVFDKCSAFEKSIHQRIDFRTFFEWYRNQEDYENQMRNDNNDYRDHVLESVRNAVYSILDDFSDLRVERNPLRMTIKKDDNRLAVDQLSEGEKCTLALFGDLARRLAIANPTLPEPRFGNGIVLIDELELHLHPKWQRKIVRVLSNTFPNIQFIMTTHSPQVLGEIDERMNIFEIDSEHNEIYVKEYESLIGWNSNYILEQFMGAESINRETQKMISEMIALIDQNKLEVAEKIANELARLTHPAHEKVVEARFLINRKRRALEKN